MRSGTLPTHQVAGFAAAARRRRQLRAELAGTVTRLREALWQGIAARITDVRRNSPVDGAPHILNISVPGVDGESLRALLPDLLVSSGSACSSATREPSFVLRALGHDDALADASLRLSLGEGSIRADVDHAARRLADAVARLRALAGGDTPVAASALTNVHEYPEPVWQRFQHPAHAGCVTGVTAEAIARSRADGAVIELQLRHAQQRITDVGYQVTGCPFTVAAAQWFAEQLQGREVSSLNGQWVAATLAALEIPPEKAHCAVMIDDLAQGLAAQRDPRGTR